MGMAGELCKKGDTGARLLVTGGLARADPSVLLIGDDIVFNSGADVLGWTMGAAAGVAWGAAHAE